MYFEQGTSVERSADSMSRTKFMVCLCAFVALAAMQSPAQIYNAAGDPLYPVPGIDDPPGTVLKTIPTPTVNGLTMIGDRLFSLINPSIFEYDINTGAIVNTITLSGIVSGGYPYGLAYDVKRGQFVMSDTGTQTRGIYRADMTGKVTTYFATPGEGNVGAAYDTRRDGYWISSWNTNTLKLFDATTFAIKMNIDLRAAGCTRSVGTAYSAVNDIVYTVSRDSPYNAFVFDAGTGKIVRSWLARSVYCSAWWDRWQCPVARLSTSIHWIDAGYPRVNAKAKVSYGTTLGINWAAGSSPSKFYQAAAALTERVAGIILGNRYFPLATDPLFFLSLVNPAIFISFTGQLDSSGSAAGKVSVPSASALVGIKFSVAFVTLDAGAPLGIHAISGPWQAEITN